jgi:hypothetical protein
MTDSFRFKEENMTYDVLIMDTDNLKDAFDIGSSCIRLNGMTPQDAEALYDLLAQHEVTVCFLPHKE